MKNITGIKMETHELTPGQRLRLLGHAIYGRFYGYNNGKVKFLDEETNEINYYEKDEVEVAYEKWR